MRTASAAELIHETSAETQFLLHCARGTTAISYGVATAYWGACGAQLNLRAYDGGRVRLRPTVRWESTTSLENN